jgi:DNA-binding HxlR family transcriptional regulator
MGFNQLSRALMGISQNTLAQRLHDLEALGVLTRSVLSVTPPATLYTLELPGRRLSDAVTALAQWGDRWLTGNDEMRRYPPSTFVGTRADRQARALGRRNHALSR